MSALFDILARRIRRRGPLTVAEYMEQALAHAEHGYYRTRDPLGRLGDFITAPEISQVFGELIGLWCADAWERMGRPERVALVELGPGRGTLMADALRAARALSGFRAALEIHLVETSPVLRKIQERTLADAGPTWHDTIETLPELPILAVANEFFDALPIHQFVRVAEGWRERLVDLDPSGDGFSFTIAPRPTRASPIVPERLAEAPLGSAFEISPLAVVIVRKLAEQLVERGGAALAIDYGYVLGGRGDTLQALRGHQRHEVLAEPGMADLTAHVDFTALADAAVDGGGRCHGPVTQGSFLQALGIETRLAALLANATAAQAEDLASGVRRLIDPAEMGTLFKVLAFADPKLPALAALPADLPQEVPAR